MSEPLQVWVRNDKGQVYGPLSPPSIELLIDNNVIAGRMQISTDGMNYVYPGRVPGLRMIFPKETWGDTIVPGEQLDAEWGQVVLPAAIHGQGAAALAAAPEAPAAPPGGPVGVPTAGPGIRGPVAGPGIRTAPTAGPGATRPGNPPPRPPVQSRPSGVAAPPMRSSPSVADFMNTGSPGSAVRPAGPAPAAAPARSAPSVADFLNAASGAPRQASAAPASSGSGQRAAPPPPAATGDAQVPASGTLGATLSTPHLYYLAVVSEVTGLLTVKLADRELVVHFKKGNPEFFDSTHPEDSLDTFLLAQKLATREQLTHALSQSERFGGELLGALFGLGLLNPNAVFQHLGQRAGQLLLKVLSADQGSFTFDLEELPASRSMPLGNKWAVYLEALRKVPSAEVRRRLQRSLDNPVMKAGRRVAVTDLRLTPQETRALNYFDGVRSLNQLARDVPAEADTILRTAWMLAPVELVSFADVTLDSPRAAAPPPRPPPPKTPAPAPASAPAPAPAAAPSRVPGPPVMASQPSGVRAAAPGNPVQMPKPGMPYPGSSQSSAAASSSPSGAAPAPQRPAPPVMKPPAPVVTAAKPAAPAPAVDFAAELKQLQATHELMKKQNFFEILGLKRDADPGAVKIAYLKAARSYHPDTVAPGSPEPLAKLKADVFALISEANRTLSDPALRKDYEAELDAGGTGSKVDIEKLLRAEELFQKGRILVQARKYADALKLLDEAVACNGDEAEFYAWRGYARFLAASDRKSMTNEALRDLNLCVAKNANVAAAYYFLGFIAKFNGDQKGAMSNFKKCVALDPKHIDAMREVRSEKK